MFKRNWGAAYYMQEKQQKKQIDTIEDLTKAVELDPKPSALYIDRAIAYSGLGMFDKALEDLNKSIDLKPDEASAYTERGFIYHKLGKLNEALADFTKAIELTPGDAQAYVNRSNIYHLLRMFNEAISDDTQAITLNSKFAIAYHNRGITHFINGNLDKAIADFTKAIEFDPKYVDAYHHRAVSYYKSGNKLGDGLCDVLRALTIDPKHKNALYELDFIFNQNKHEEIIKAIKNLSEDSAIHLLSQARNPKTILGQKFDEWIVNSFFSKKFGTLKMLDKAYCELTAERIKIRNAALNIGWWARATNSFFSPLPDELLGQIAGAFKDKLTSEQANKIAYDHLNTHSQFSNSR